MSSVFQLRYTFVWNVHSVFNFVHNQQCVEDLSLKARTLQLTFLPYLLSGQRHQTSQVLRLDQMTVASNTYVFNVINKLKQTPPCYHQTPLVNENYFSEHTLCIYSHLTQYIELH